MCHAKPTHNFAFFRPNNDPDLQNDVLWVNNLSLDENRKLMSHFPGRSGYVLLRRKDCRVMLIAARRRCVPTSPPSCRCGDARARTRADRVARMCASRSTFVGEVGRVLR